MSVGNRLSIEAKIVGGRVIEQGSFSESVETPQANTQYTVPSTGYLDLRFFTRKEFRVWSDQAVEVQLEESDDTATWRDLEGYSIPSGSFAAGKWNTILTDKPMKYVRLRITTGATPPSRIDVSVEAVL